jgi:hypothetical protein
MSHLFVVHFRIIYKFLGAQTEEKGGSTGKAFYNETSTKVNHALFSV